MIKTPLLSFRAAGSGLSSVDLPSASNAGMKRIRLQDLHKNDELDPTVHTAPWGGMDSGWGMRGANGVGTEEGMSRPGVGGSRIKGGVRSSGGRRKIVEGETLLLKKVSRLQMGSYLCIASNGIPPSVSKRAHLKVQCMCLYSFSSPCPALPTSPLFTFFAFGTHTLTRFSLHFCLPVTRSRKFASYPSPLFHPMSIFCKLSAVQYSFPFVGCMLYYSSSFLYRCFVNRLFFSRVTLLTSNLISLIFSCIG